MFFFALALMLAHPFSIVSPSWAQEAGVAAPVADPASVPGAAMLEIAANYQPFPKTTTQLVVNISVNTESRGDFFVEIDDEGILSVKVEDLKTLKLNFAEDRTVLIRNDRYAPLGALRDVEYSFDEKNLTVAIVGKTTESRKTAIDVYQFPSRPQNVYYPRENSAFLNYGATYSYADPLGFQSLNVTTKLGLRSGDVFFVSDSLYTKLENSEQFVRLLSTATYERRDNLQWLVLGDQFANSGDLGSTVNMGGIGFSKVYKLDPYFTTQPLFSVKGTTAFPSQAEIYMDGVLVGKHPVAPGAFELKNLYSYGGVHNIDVVLKDPFGNEQRISYPMYFSTLMLREGLHEYSYNAGFMREQYGVASNEYGKPVFSAFHRYGLTNSLNIGARAEGSDGIYNGGISSSFIVPRFGLIALSLAGSVAHGATGTAGSFQHSYQFGSFNTNLLLRGFSRDYAAVGNPPSADMTRYEMSLGAGFLLLPLGSLSLSYSKRDTYGGVNTQVMTASYSRGLSKSASLFATASAVRQGDTTYSFFIGLNFNLEKNIRGAAQYSKTGSANAETLQLQKDVPVGEGIGYRASLNRSDTGAASKNSFNPYLQYNARYGIYTLDSTIQDSAGSTSASYNVSAAGSLVYAGGFYGISRPVSDSFGIVMVDKLPNATVLINGSEVGKTGSSGMMVVPSLASYSQNQITLDVKNIPIDYSISVVNVKISPSLWSGSCMSFDALKVQAVTGSLYAITGERKTPLEYIEISMEVGESKVTFPTGKGGEFYLENIITADSKKGATDDLSCSAIAERRESGGNYIKPGSYRAWGEFEGKKCEISLVFPATEDLITDLGEIQCVTPR